MKCAKCSKQFKREGFLGADGKCLAKAACSKRRSQQPMFSFASGPPKMGEAGWETWMSM